MGSFSFWHWLIVLLVILIIFGAGKLPKVAGDLAAGIKNFKKGMTEEDKAEPAKSIPVEPNNPSSTAQAAAREKASQS